MTTLTDHGSAHAIEVSALARLRSILHDGEAFSLNPRTGLPRLIRYLSVTIEGGSPLTRFVVLFTDDNEPGSRFGASIRAWGEGTLEDPDFAAGVLASLIDEWIDAEGPGLPAPSASGDVVWADFSD